MKTRHFFACAAFTLVASLPAQTLVEPSASESTSRRTTTVRHFSRLLGAIDSDRDGIISSQELRLAPIALTACDLDEDGFLQRNEFRPARVGPNGRSLFRPMIASLPGPSVDDTLMFVLDANHDGVIQPIEVANAASSLRRLDANHDETLTGAELRAAADIMIVAVR